MANTIESIGVSLEQWFKLPLELRQRWWKETDYGKKAPSPELVREIVTSTAS